MFNCFNSISCSKVSSLTPINRKHLKSRNQFVWIGMIFLLMPCLVSAESGSLGKPTWIGNHSIESDTGFGKLEWEIEHGSSADLFKLEEKTNGPWKRTYVTGRSLNIYRGAPVAYQFKISACQKDNNGNPVCGQTSNVLRFEVNDTILDPLIERGFFAGENPDGDQPIAAEPVHSKTPGEGTSPVTGGPGELAPGIWYSENKQGMGWSFYWSNKIATQSNTSAQYDLAGIWYTFAPKDYSCEDQTPDNLGKGETPSTCSEIIYSQWRPMVLTMDLVNEDSNTPDLYTGPMYFYHEFVSQEGPEPVQFGSADLEFLPSFEADFTWGGTFAPIFGEEEDDWQNITERLKILAGDTDPQSCGPSELDPCDPGDLKPTDLGGLWNSSGSWGIDDNGELVMGSIPSVAVDLGKKTEVAEVIFFNDSGNLTWIQSVPNDSNTNSQNDYCYRYLDGGFDIRLPNSSIPTSWWVTNGCNSSNPNGSRDFSIGDFEDAGFWVDFDLPAGGPPNTEGSVQIESASGGPVNLKKATKFHRITINNGPGCSISPSQPTCNVEFTWLTDGYFPQVGIYARDVATGQSSLLYNPASGVYFDIDKSRPLDMAGTYVLEVRQSDENSRVIAESGQFQVTGESQLTQPSNIRIIWNNSLTLDYKVLWDHSDHTQVDHFVLEQKDPNSNTLQFDIDGTASPYWDSGASSVPWGTYQYRVKACATPTNANCSGFTSWFDWYIEPESSELQRPWTNNEYGTLDPNSLVDVAAGFHFVPLRDGYISELRGFFEGSYVVKLFNYDTGVELAQAIVTADGSNWSHAQIPPVNVEAQQKYTVAAYIVDGGTRRTGVNFFVPDVFDDIRITASTSANGLNTIPTDHQVFVMLGQADIGFVPTGPALEPPEITPFANDTLTNTEGDVVGIQVLAEDPDGSIDQYLATGLPEGLEIDEETGWISGTIQAGEAFNSPHTVNLTVIDDHDLSDSYEFAWIVNIAPQGCTDFYYDNFETTNNWTRDFLNADSASDGLWERANPQQTDYDNTVYQLGFTYSQPWALVTNGAGNPAYDSDVDGPWDGGGATTTIWSEEINVPAGGTDHELSFWYSFAFNWAYTSVDTFSVSIYDVGTSQTTVVYLDQYIEQSELPSPPDHGLAKWKFRTVDVSSFAGKTVRIKILASDGGTSKFSPNLVEAQVDDVRMCHVPDGGNSAPVVTNPGDQFTATGQTLNPPLNITVFDLQGDDFTCSMPGLPSGLSWVAEPSEGRCVVSGTISATVGDYPVTVTASDGSLTSDPVDFTWHVSASGGGSGSPENPPSPASSPGYTTGEINANSIVGATSGTFLVDEAGTATYSIPILTAPGSGGVAPLISLDYSSQGGNTEVGLGWSIGGMSSITRCGQTLAQDGVDAERGITLTSSDRFCLDGERMMLVSGLGYGAPGSEYRLEKDNFTKIVSNSTAGTGPQSFTVWRKDGSITQYGATTNSRIEAQASSDGTVLIWAQNRISDSATNYIDFTYEETPSSVGQPVEYVLSRVDYTGNTTASTPTYAELIFTYSSSRSDATQRSVAGATISLTRLLTRIDSRAKAGPGSSMENLRSYFLGYTNDGYGRNILQSVTECNDSTQSFCFAPAEFGWHKPSHNFDEQQIPSVNVGGVFPGSYKGMALADINGDARPDLLITEPDTNAYKFKIAFATASGGFDNSGSVFYPLPENHHNGEAVEILAIDLNADGFQDVIYPDQQQWKARISTETGLGDEFVVAECCQYIAPSLVRVMDVDGDGLSDLVTNQWEVTMFLRNKFTPPFDSKQPIENQLGFETPTPISVSLLDEQGQPVFPSELIGEGWHITGDPIALHFWNSGLEERNTRTFDYNGDGSVDVLVKLTAYYCHESQGNCPPPPPSPDAPSGGNVPPFPEPAPGSFPVELLVVLESRRTLGGFYRFELAEVVAVGSECYVLVPICNDYPSLPEARNFLAADINADGLGDFVYRTPVPASNPVAEDGTWYVKLNNGAGFSSTPIPIVDVDEEERAIRARFADLNGNGFPEFLYPSAVGDSYWLSVENLHGMDFATVSTTTAFPTGDYAQDDLSAFIDFNGDGMLDNLYVNQNGSGSVSEAKLRLSNDGVSNTEMAATLMDYISTGIDPDQNPNGSYFPSEIFINYLPLTDSDVYSRMSNSQYAQWGSGHAVYDMIAPIHVVRQVMSSAPTSSAPGGMSERWFHYAGAKIQGGGRGFLGFAEVVSYDAQLNIRTNTRLRQEFPYTGMPGDITRARPGAGRETAPLSDLETLPAWSTVNASTSQLTAMIGGDVAYGYSINEFDEFETVAGKGTKFSYMKNNLERHYTLQGNFSYKMLTSFVYNGTYGNLTQSVVKTYETDSTTAYLEQTTANVYGYDGTFPWINNWYLGRLTRSTVTHLRPHLPFNESIIRVAEFDYDPVTGILDSETVDPGTPFEVMTTYTLDLFGNRKVTSVEGVGSGTIERDFTTQYDDWGRYVEITRNHYGQQTQRVWSNDAFGNATSFTDIDGTFTSVTIDHMGRPFLSYTQDGTWTKSVSGVSNIGSECPANITSFHTLTTGGGQPDQYQCFDILGREIRTATRNFSGAFVYVDTAYDPAGRVARVSEPHFEGGTAQWNDTTYDDFNRIESILAVDGNDHTYDYDDDLPDAQWCGVNTPRQVRIRNGLDQTQLEVRNALGETTHVYDENCEVVTYVYDPVGNPLSVTGVDGAVVAMQYDDVGRNKIAMQDPDKGDWEYAYNALGELTRQLDSKNQAIDFVYDEMGRVTNRFELENVGSLGASGDIVNEEVTTWNNGPDGNDIGKVDHVQYLNNAGQLVHERDMTYDDFGRVSQIETVVDGMVFFETTTYDQHSRIFQQFDASGDMNGVRYHYKPESGDLWKVQEARYGTNGDLYQQIDGIDQWGQITGMTLGEGAVTIQAGYEAVSGRLDWLQATSPSGLIQNVDYTFDVLGNLLNRHDESVGRNVEEIFTHDDLNRLESVFLSVNGASAQAALSLNYDKAGNITCKSNASPGLQADYCINQSNSNYGYDAMTRPHAVQSVGSTTYTYDDNGNQISSTDGRTISYSIFDKPTLITKGGDFTDFTYGVGNARIKRVDNNAVDGVQTTWYLGNVERIADSGGSVIYRRYIGGVAVADYTPPEGQVTRYLVQDHLGSTHAITDQSGNLIQHQSFTAFGQRANAATYVPLDVAALIAANDPTTRGFTGHEHVDGLGVIHMNGRIYDPKLGRFLQADPIVQNIIIGQNLNRYSYVLNNPLKYTDPSGYEVPLVREVVQIVGNLLNSIFSYQDEYDEISLPQGVPGWNGAIAEGAVSEAYSKFNGPKPPRGRWTNDLRVAAAGDTYSKQTDGKFENGNWTRLDKSAAMAADAAYNMDGGLLGVLGIEYDPRDGFSATLVLTQDGFMLAFRGSEFELEDWLANGQQGLLGLPASQYDQAVELAQDVEQALGKGNVIYVGHSLGGGLASAAASAMDGKAIVFNPAGLNSIYNRGGGHNIRAHIVIGEVLSTLQNDMVTPIGGILPDTVGNRIYHEPNSVFDGPVERHSRDQFTRR